MPLTSFGLNFADGNVLNATQVNAIGSKLNEIVVAYNTLEGLFSSSANQLVLNAIKNTSVLNLVNDGVARGIPGWTAFTNLNGWFSTANGTFTIPGNITAATYEIHFKTLIQATGVTGTPRAKIWLSRNSNELAVSEKQMISYQGALRTDFQSFWCGTLSPGDVITVQYQSWDAATASILGDANTMLLIKKSA